MNRPIELNGDLIAAQKNIIQERPSIAYQWENMNYSINSVVITDNTNKNKN